MSEDRVILIKGDQTNWYEQAIFIVKSGVPRSKMPLDLVAEAERIINGYANQQRRANTMRRDNSSASGTPAHKRRKRNAFDTVLNVVMLLSCSVLVGVLVYAFVR